MNGLKIGHFTQQENGTGVTVFLFEYSAIGAYWNCGSAPASHEIFALDPENSVPKVYGLVFTGGSAFGLYASKGVMTYLSECGIGHPTLNGVVPIVPTAAIYDLAYKKPIPPTDNDAYKACLSAKENNTTTGRIGAGTGATIGKLIPDAKQMTGGLGRAELTLSNGIQVIAYAVVNCVGDVRDGRGKIVAGASDVNGEFLDCESYILTGVGEKNLFVQANTTLVSVFTNAKFSKSELKRIAKMATAGMPRAVSPIFTRYDGDMLFFVSLGEYVASELTIGTIAAEVVRLAILDAVKESEIIE